MPEETVTIELPWYEGATATCEACKAEHTISASDPHSLQSPGGREVWVGLCEALACKSAGARLLATKPVTPYEPSTQS